MNPESALIISDEEYSGYLTHNPNNVVNVYATAQITYDVNTPSNTITIPQYQPTVYTANNPDNTFITL